MLTAAVDLGEVGGAAMLIRLMAVDAGERAIMEAGGVAMIITLMATHIILIRTVASGILIATPTSISDTVMVAITDMEVTAAMVDMPAAVTVVMATTVAMVEVAMAVTSVTATGTAAYRRKESTSISMEHHGTLFHDALRRLGQAFPYSGIDEEALEKLKHPKAILEVSVPVRMDDGSSRDAGRLRGGTILV